MNQNTRYSFRVPLPITVRKESYWPDIAHNQLDPNAVIGYKRETVSSSFLNIGRYTCTGIVDASIMCVFSL
jgi:hypothetical protein